VVRVAHVRARPPVVPGLAVLGARRVLGPVVPVATAARVRVARVLAVPGRAR
jgi:hypothetical protein